MTTLGRGGTRPTATRLKVLRGQRPGRPARARGKAPPPGRPKCPAWLGKLARAKWRQTVPVLERLGVLSAVDGDILACYCVAWEELQEATLLLAKDGRTTLRGSGGLGPHPAITMQRTALRLLKELGALLGLSPAARRNWLDNPAASDDDPLGEWMSGGEKPAS
jgi:P27 family predicted phage terminase small subunit